VVSVAEARGYPELAGVARSRIDSLSEVASPLRMYEREEVRSSASAQAAPTIPMNTQLGGSLAPDSPATSADPFDFGSGPLPTPPPGVEPASPSDEDAPTP